MTLREQVAELYSDKCRAMAHWQDLYSRKADTTEAQRDFMHKLTLWLAERDKLEKLERCAHQARAVSEVKMHAPYFSAGSRTGQ